LRAAELLALEETQIDADQEIERPGHPVRTTRPVQHSGYQRFASSYLAVRVLRYLPDFVSAFR
jgi:hypothetical protein